MGFGKIGVIFFALAAALAASFAFLGSPSQPNNPSVRHKVLEESNPPLAAESENFSDPAPQPQALSPESIILNVPFTPQAPSGSWTLPFKEACEEASALMAAEYFSGNRQDRLEAGYAEQEILKLVEWENSQFGYNRDTDTEETAEMVKKVYGLNVKILANYSQEDLKNELAQGRLIIFPADGQMLNNPNFRQPGPPYHMLVIKGYDKNNFIANDPGTKNGMSYPYSFATLYQANGGWDRLTKKVNQEKKEAIAVWQ